MGFARSAGAEDASALAGGYAMQAAKVGEAEESWPSQDGSLEPPVA